MHTLNVGRIYIPKIIPGWTHSLPIVGSIRLVKTNSLPDKIAKFKLVCCFHESHGVCCSHNQRPRDGNASSNIGLIKQK